MTSIAIVLYIRTGESFPVQLTSVITELTTRYHTKLFLFSDSHCEIPAEITCAVRQNRTAGTKYVKLNEIITQDDSEYLISIDNDITPNIEASLRFVDATIAWDNDIGWAQIAALPSPPIISQLITIDKLLSHRIIRPLLWQCRIGISIPGQFFIIRRELFNGKLPNIDTFLDDLALGLYVNRHRREMHLYYFKQVVGFEKPNETFKGLCTQRRRWATGYLSVMRMAETPAVRTLVLIHGFAYHGWWLVHLLLFIALCYYDFIVAGVYLLGVTLLCCIGDIRYFFHGLLYQLIFPIFHLVWFKALLIGQREFHTRGKGH